MSQKAEIIVFVFIAVMAAQGILACVQQFVNLSTLPKAAIVGTVVGLVMAFGIHCGIGNPHGRPPASPLQDETKEL